MTELAIRGGKPVRAARKPPRLEFAPTLVEELREVLGSGALNRFYGGRHVRAFERQYAGFFGREHAVACNSGTSALHLAYLAARLPEFSEILLPANCYISAISAAIQCDLVPVIVDIDPVTWVMSVDDAKAKLTPRTSAIVPVHMWGAPCAMTELNRFAAEAGLVTVEDCSHSHGSVLDDRLTGQFSEVACWSVCCFKHVTAGEGGMLATDDARIADTARSLAHKGKGVDFLDYRELGFSYGMTELQAVVATRSLDHLPVELAERARNAAVLDEALSGLEVGLPTVPEGAAHAYAKYPILLPPSLAGRRDAVVEALAAENIEAGPAHPYVLHIDWLREQRPSLFRDPRAGRLPDYSLGSCPVAADVVGRQVTLDVGPGLDENDMTLAAEAVRKVLWHFLTAEASH